MDTITDETNKSTLFNYYNVNNVYKLNECNDIGAIDFETFVNSEESLLLDTGKEYFCCEKCKKICGDCRQKKYYHCDASNINDANLHVENYQNVENFNTNTGKPLVLENVENFNTNTGKPLVLENVENFNTNIGKSLVFENFELVNNINFCKSRTIVLLLILIIALVILVILVMYRNKLNL